MTDAILVIALGAAIAGFVQGLTGFAFGLTALAFWAWVLDPRVASPLLVMGSLLGHLFSLHRARRGFEIGRVVPMLVGGVAGIPVGVVLLKHINPNAFKLGVGLLLAIYCPTMLLSHRIAAVERLGAVADGVAGAASGVMSGLGGIGGPISTLWCTLRGWNRDAFRATFQSFAFAMQIATFIAYAVAGVVTRKVLADFVLIAPALVVPAFLGGRLYGSFSDLMFRRIVLGLLTISGGVLIFNAIILR